MLFGTMSFTVRDLAVFIVVISICFVVVYSRRGPWHARTHQDIHQIHSTNVNPTPRLGGVAILSACIVVVPFIDGYFGDRYAKFIVSMFPFAAVCLWEDIMRPTSPTMRLFATVTSIMLTMAFLEVKLARLDIDLIDPWMGGVVGYAITLVFVAGTVNGFNMIDGLNGLCGVKAVAALVAIMAISVAVGYDFMMTISMTVAVSIVAFLIFNFPNSRIFLGDTGTYSLGYILGWFSISILHRSPEVSPWALFLILGYPLFELLLTVLRRIAMGRSPFVADQAHLHHIVLFAVRELRNSNRGNRWDNPIATLLIMPLALGPMFYAVHFYDNRSALLIGTFFYGGAFIFIYYLLLRRFGPKNGLKQNYTNSVV